MTNSSSQLGTTLTMSSTVFCPNLKISATTYANAHIISHCLRMSMLSWNKTLYLECYSLTFINWVSVCCVFCSYMCGLLSSFLSLYFTLCLMCVGHMSLKDLLTYLLAYNWQLTGSSGVLVGRLAAQNVDNWERKLPACVRRTRCGCFNVHLVGR